MTSWENRPQEERALLNPAFCASLLWRAARARKVSSLRALAFEESFLVLPLILASSTRDLLPSRLSTSLPVWLENNPLEQRRLIQRSRILVPFTKTALLFASTRAFLRIEDGLVLAVEKWTPEIRRFERDATEEIRKCSQKADFVSKWFASAGDAATVLALMGTRP